MEKKNNYLDAEEKSMNDFESCKKILTGIYTKNSELREIDDSIFIQLIQAGVEEVAGDDSDIHDALLDHVLTLYITEWVQMAIRDEENPDLDEEKKVAREEFMDYWHAEI